jgi:hypothetical protein
MPAFSLAPGDFYFSLNGQPAFIFSRNIAGYQMNHYNTFLDWSKAGGSKVARIQLDSTGFGYTSDGKVDENWASQWDLVFDKARADGIFILPVFSGWFDWNSGDGYSTWSSNPFNQANGGPALSPGELFLTDSVTQTMWLQWMQTLVERWRGRDNILGWEIFSEVNLASDNTESTGINFVNTAAAVIRNVNPTRPVTASLADDGRWLNFYRETNIDFINIHPYSAYLDQAIVSEVRKKIESYNRPVLIGESGVSGAENYPAKGEKGVRHAIWAAIVSGAMNGRALYWEDSFGLFFENLGMDWMKSFELEELPAANFVNGVSFLNFQPLTSTSTSGVWGAAVGSEKIVLGWFRDITCEPPDWNMLPVVSNQTVTISIPGAAVNWKVDFYDTKSGTDIISSTMVTRKDNTITLTLPGFTDDIAFKLYAQE